ncbi:hypothetical protein QJS66_06370 [Kocuria rhizophila]|nr:hypothetical protein QJS66_06370 [Kocuria rhizophila]
MFPAATRGAALGIRRSRRRGRRRGPLLGGVLRTSRGGAGIFWSTRRWGSSRSGAPRCTCRGTAWCAATPWTWWCLGLPGLGLFLVVFGIQEGQSHEWSTVAGPVTIPMVIGAGVLVLVAFLAPAGRHAASTARAAAAAHAAQLHARQRGHGRREPHRELQRPSPRCSTCRWCAEWTPTVAALKLTHPCPCSLRSSPLSWAGRWAGWHRGASRCPGMLIMACWARRVRPEPAPRHSVWLLAALTLVIGWAAP